MRLLIGAGTSFAVGVTDAALAHFSVKAEELLPAVYAELAAGAKG